MASTGSEHRCIVDQAVLEAQDFGRFYKCPRCGVKYQSITTNNAYTAGYYFFPWNMDQAAEKPKPTCTLDVMKIHEEAVEKVLADMPRIQKLIIYRQLYASDMRINGIDREIHKEAAKELKALKAAEGTP